MSLKRNGTRPLRTLVAATVLACSLAGTGTAGAALICGDYNGDSSVTAPDALGTLRTAVKLETCQRALCDFTGDNVITTRDALAILKTSVGTGPEPMCPVAGCNGPECKPTCASKEVACCDDWTCSGNGECAIEEDAAVCECKEGWVGATCNAPAALYPFASKPSKDPPAWTQVGDLLVRPPSYGEQMRYDLRPGTFFVANAKLIAEVEGGKPATTVPFVFPDGQVEQFDLEIKASYDSDVRLVERRTAGSFAQVDTRFPKVVVYRSLYETDGSVRSVMQILAVEDGGFVSRGITRHDSNMPDHEGVYSTKVSPLSTNVELDDIVPVNGTIDDSTMLITEAFFSNSHQAELFDDCDGLSICSDLCADTGLDQGDPGPACPAPPDPCEHVSPCGDGHGPGDPILLHHCNDGDDNDNDGFVDGADPQCDHSPACEPGGSIPAHVHQWEAGMDFAIFADVLWCTYRGDNWPSDLLDLGYVAESPFHKGTGNSDYDTLYKWGNPFFSIHEKLARLKTIGCWVMDSIPESEECADDLAQCGPFSAGAHTYPYHYGRDAAGFWDGVKADTWHARGIGMNEPLTAAQALTKSLNGASEAEFIPGFASVVGTNVNGQDANPHELGHSANLTHCDVRLVNGLWTLEGNSLQNDNCGPGEFGPSQQMRWSHVSGMKLYNCFSDGCAIPRFGEAAP
jgi:hypothetical protein